MEIKSLTVGLPVIDMCKAIEWYRRLLGDCKEIYPAEGVMEFELTPRFWLQLFKSELSPPSRVIVRIGVVDIEGEHKRLMSLGIDASPIEVVPGVVRYFNFKDPFGNMLGMYQVL